MCGRFVRKSTFREIAERFSIPSIETPEEAASYNITPRQLILAVMQKDKRSLVTMGWGLVPHWAKDKNSADKLINARAESLAEKPSFHDSFRNRRCLIVADGFYEWRKQNGTGVPFFVCMRDEKPFGLAGLYDRWTDETGKELTTCTIITTEANVLLRSIHDRMPVIVEPRQYDTWLNPDVFDITLLQSLLKPFNPALMKTYRVSQMVNSPENNSEECIKPAN